MAIYFFVATNTAHNQITELFDFVWSTASAMWNLRWQVGGYMQAVPDATEAQLRARFTDGSGVRWSNLKRACIKNTWEEQQETFARFLLINNIAIYEGWLDEVLQSLGMNTKTNRNSLQFPPPSGGTASICAMTAVESVVMKFLHRPLFRSKLFTFNNGRTIDVLSVLQRT